MGTEKPHQQLHVAFFPMMAAGHVIPTLDMVRLFSARDVKTTIITTPLNAPNLAKSFKDIQVTLEIFPFPFDEAGIPQGIESLDHCSSPETTMNFVKGMQLLGGPLEEFLQRTRPDCLVADAFFPFAVESAAKFDVPVIEFLGTSFFSLCVNTVLIRDKHHMSVSSDEEPFSIPNFPHPVGFTRLEMLPDMRVNDLDSDLMKILGPSFMYDRTYGAIVNSFYELEPEYADYYRKVLGKRAWHIGPVFLCNRVESTKASVDEHECLKWLDSKQPNSVIYVCFGSVTRFSSSQLHELAVGLEASGQQFIWVMKKPMNQEDNEEPWLPKGFEERTKDKGQIIRGWAPQRLILEHEAIGGFVTHCGWNSTLEAIAAGVPMVAWPVSAEQFFNGKLVTEVLNVGISIGSKVWSMIVEGSIINHEQVEVTLKKLMVGEEAAEMRTRAKKLKEMAWKAMKEGGSSYSDLTALLHDLSSKRQKHHSI